MPLKITQSSLLEKKFLIVKPDRVVVSDTSVVLSGKKHHDYREIDCVLMGPDYVLSIQFGDEVFTIQTHPGQPRDREVIDTLLQNVKAAQGG